MFCPQCGAPNDDDSLFCGNCGAVLDAEDLVGEEPAGAEAEILQDAGESHDEPEPEETPLDAELPAFEPPPQPPAPPRVPPARTSTSPPTSGLAVASLLLGIGGLTILPFLGSIAAIILGYMARSEIRRRPGEIGGEGVAMAGVILGWISVGLAILSIVVIGGLGLCGACGALGAGSY
jgi:hypothetical protein